MIFLILAAGKGSRLGRHTKNCPKPLVHLNGKPLLEYQLSTAAHCGITENALVTGYCADAFLDYGLETFHNPNYQTTNMLYSLMCARDLFQSEDIIISYGDIVYTPDVLRALIDNPQPFVISADSHWRELWQLRMEDPLTDAESFKYDDGYRLTEIGKPLKSYEDAQAQYIGLIKIRASLFSQIIGSFDKMEAQMQRNAYFTDFVQACITDKLTVVCQLHKRQWLEVDTCEDLDTYEFLITNGQETKLGFPEHFFAP